MADMNSKYQRIYSIVSDKHGIDPIRNKLIPLINDIQSYSTHTVTQDERAAPDLISEREYRTDEFWWIILAYNGISSYRTLVEGLDIKIPSYEAIIKLVNENTVRPNKVQRTITI